MPNEAPADIAKLSFLVIEDEEFSRAAVTQTLGAMGATNVATAVDGFVARFGDFIEAESAHAHHKRRGVRQERPAFFLIWPVDEGSTRRSTPGTDQVLRCQALQSFADGGT